MSEKDSYRDFQDEIFREIDDLQSEHNKYLLFAACREFGLSFQEAARMYYKPGMTGQQFLDAMRADRDKSSQS